MAERGVFMANNNMAYKVNIEWFERISDDIFVKPHAMIAKVLEGANNIAIELHNIAAEALNPHYEEWNKEADTLEGDAYYEFLNKKQNAVLEEVEWPENCRCESMTICGDPCIIVPLIKFPGNDSVYAASITLKPV